MALLLFGAPGMARSAQALSFRLAPDGVTILTMMGIVLISLRGINLIPLKGLERYAHALAGGTICLCGIAVQFLGV